MSTTHSIAKGNPKKVPVICLLTALFSLLLPVAGAFARDVSFIWSPNPESVDGYRIYYKTGSSGPPYNGTGAGEGPSPVATGNVTTYTLHGLSDTETYYFALTAYLGTNESGYSTEIVLPVASPPATGRTVSFVWSPNPETVDGYRLYYEDIAVGDTCPSPSAAYDSQDATEGPSPVATGNVTTYTLQGLSVDKTYCFALTAYIGAQESGYTAPIQLTGNNPPVATAAVVSTNKNTSVNGQLPASDPDGDALTYSIVTNGTKGSAAITNPATGAFTYTPNTNATGSDSFTFKVNDGKLDSNTATVSVTINVVNAAPTATGGFFVTDENTPVSGLLLASDPDGDALSYSIVTNGTKGSAAITNPATGAFTYTPNTNATGSDSFTFRVNDGTVNSNTATVSVTINAVNEAPTASGTSVTTNEDTAVSGQLSATDPDGDALTYSIVTNGTKGSAAITNPATGAFTYTPNTNVNGSDSFTFRVNDGTVNSNTATVAVTITAVNDAPVATGTSVTTNEDTAVSGQLSATDPDGNTLTFSIVTNGTKGSAAITNPTTGAFTYTPSENQTGSDSFTFRANDGTVNSNTATVAVTITTVNDAPIATGTSVTTNEDTAVSGQLSATDPDGNTLTFSIVTNGTKGSAAITNPATGAFTYTPNTNATGSDSFTFRVNDGTVNSNTATVAVTITAVNDLPVVVNTSIATKVNTAASGQMYAADPDGNALTYSIVTNGTKGSAAITNPATGAFTYTPSENKTGSDSFTFKVNDGTVDSGLATISVTIFDASSITKVFGDTTGADYPGTLADTYTNLNADINASAEVVKTHSKSTQAPHKVANTLVLKADLSSIPAYATVEEAKIYLYQTGASGEFQYSNSVHKITGKNPIVSQVTGYNAFNGEPWSPVPEGTTHNNIPLGLADIEPQEDAIPLFNIEGYRSWTITGIVQEWVMTPSTNYGLLIRGENTATETGRTFAAKENQNTALRPKLVVRYRLVPPAPTLILIEEIK